MSPGSAVCAAPSPMKALARKACRKHLMCTRHSVNLRLFHSCFRKLETFPPAGLRVGRIRCACLFRPFLEWLRTEAGENGKALKIQLVRESSVGRFHSALALGKQCPLSGRGWGFFGLKSSYLEGGGEGT